MSREKIESRFLSLGGQFASLPDKIADAFSGIKAVIFDWDGVFNDGRSFNDGSIFSEVDSMATNMLRFALWLRQQELPKSIIITGSNNYTALKFGKREHFDAVYLNAKDKYAIFGEILANYGLNEKECLFFFDDILDLSVAEVVGLRMMIGSDSRPMLSEFVKNRSLADYISGQDGGNYGLRESIELLLALSGQFDEVVEKRMRFEGDYEKYWDERNKVPTTEKLL